MVFITFLMVVAFLRHEFTKPRKEEEKKEEGKTRSEKRGKEKIKSQRAPRDKVKRSLCGEQADEWEEPLKKVRMSPKPRPPTRETQKEKVRKEKVKKCVRRWEGKKRIGETSAGLGHNPSISVSDFRFHHHLGSGAFGNVFSASYRNNGQLMAVKVIRKDADSNESILSECRTMSLAGECQFLCEGLAAFQTQTHAFIAMPYMWGGNLAGYLQKTVYMETFAAQFYSAEVVCGLEFLHSNGILHRDIKPENLLFDGEGHIRIADFGLVEENYIAGAWGVVGTSTHIAPEVALDMRYGTSADWWSFGITLFQMLIGCLPAHLEMMKLLQRSNARKVRQPSELPEVSRSILCELLEPDPHQRLGVRSSVKHHSFYHQISWIDIDLQNIEPPYQPQRESAMDAVWGVEEESLSFMEPETDTSSGHATPDVIFISPKWHGYTI